MKNVNIKDLKEEVKSLRDGIMVLDELYEKGEPTILDGVYYSDSDYDEMYLKYIDKLNNLKELNVDTQELSIPAKEIIFNPVESLVKVEHSTPMLSQKKIKTEEELREFAKVARISGSKVLVQEKLDGLTILATYDNGKLVRAATRGNGYIGEDITHNYRVFKNTPITIPFKGLLEVRLEALVPYDEFERINVDGLYSNPRNLASGSVRQLDPNITKDRGVIAIAFDLIQAEGLDFEYDTEMISFLEKQGFDMVGYEIFNVSTDKGLEDYIDYVLSYEDNIRGGLPYMIDGLVLKHNDLMVRAVMGYTSKYPKWACAFKFAAEESSTKIINIVDQVGKSGQITPVAILEEVEIGDVKINKASLHNYDNIMKKDIMIYDTVVILRANDVIPYIAKPLKELRTGDEIYKDYPIKCPSCGSITEFDGAHLFCTGVNCKPQMKGKLEHYVSRDALNINMGKKTIDLFFEEGILESLEDLYRLDSKKDIICKLPGFGKKSFQNIVDSVEVSKNTTLDKVLYGLSIRLVGSTASKEIANHFKTMDNIIAASSNKEDFKSQLLSLEGFGEAISQSFVDFFSNKENIDVVRGLMNMGVNMDMPEAKEVEGSNVAGKTFVITGSVEKFKNRKEIKSVLEEHGAKVTGSVSKNTDYLVNNDIESTSSKNKKAKELNIPIISEDELIELIKLKI